MHSPDVDVERIDKLVGGMPPESEREARLEGIIRELRASAPPAPASVRESVRTLREPERRRFSWRPAVVALPIAAAVAVGAVTLTRGGGESGGEAAGTALQERNAGGAEAVPPQTEALAPAGGAADDSAAQAMRAQEWDVTLELRVPDNDRLSAASADAIRTTRSLGGYVVSSSVATEERYGEARLVVRVPSRRVQDAIAELSELGTITAQQVDIQDRQGELDRLARRVDALRVQIARLNLRLSTEELTDAQRLELQLRRQRLQGLVNSYTATRTAVAREVALAEIRLTIRTGEPAVPPAEGRIEGAARDALQALSVAAAGAVFLLILLSPLVALAVIGWVARRAWRRRADERLLERPRPAAADQ